MDFVIAVDGTAASGKGTIASGLAKLYGLPYLDTGLLYRAVGQAVWEAGGDPSDPVAATAAAAALDPLDLDRPGLRTAAAGEAASLVAAHPGVRRALLAHQEAFARRPGGGVLDGRDIGTVIAPFAAAKLFVDADLEVRARRRWLQTGGGEGAASLKALTEDLRRRDARDAGRSDAPLARAPDAVLLDTSELSISQAADAARRIVEAARARWMSNHPDG